MQLDSRSDFRNDHLAAPEVSDEGRLRTTTEAPATLHRDSQPSALSAGGRSDRVVPGTATLYAVRNMLAGL